MEEKSLHDGYIGNYELQTHVQMTSSTYVTNLRYRLRYTCDVYRVGSHGQAKRFSGWELVLGANANGLKERKNHKAKVSTEKFVQQQ